MANPVDEAVQAWDDLARWAEVVRDMIAKLPRGLSDAAFAERKSDAESLFAMSKDPIANVLGLTAMIAIGHDTETNIADEFEIAIMRAQEDYAWPAFDRQDELAADAQHEREAA